MSATPNIFIDLPVLLDYCRTHVQDCNDTRVAVDNLNKKGGYLEISSRVYEFWEESVLNMLSLLRYLKGKADERALEDDFENPKQNLVTEILDRDHLNETDEVHFQISEKYEDEIDTHIEYLQEYGLDRYRVYLDTHLKNCSKAHNKMDGMIDNRFGPGGSDRTWTKLRMENFTEHGKHLNSLIDGHYWCKSGGDLLLIRDDERVTYSTPELKRALLKNVGQDIPIRSPREVLRSLS